MRNKRLQNQVTAGRFTLPAVTLICTLCWVSTSFLFPQLASIPTQGNQPFFWQSIQSFLLPVIASAVLLFVWPVLFGALVALGKGIAGLGAVGAGIYAFFNRLLIPFGLHHALNNVFWFDTIGLGDLSHFWAGETSADVSWSLGMYMSGFFPCMMFGIPGAALAMVHTAKSNKKKAAIGLVSSAAIAAFVCGVTEPFEFGFMFLAPVLYLVYAVLYGIFTVVTVLLGFRAGFSFSAGLTDLVFSASLPAAAKTWLIIPLGIAAFVVFYVVFRFAIGEGRDACKCLRS